MLRSIKTTKHNSVIAIVALCTMSGGFEKNRSINFSMDAAKNMNVLGFSSFDFLANKPSYYVGNCKNERVKEIKCVFV